MMVQYPGVVRRVRIRPRRRFPLREAPTMLLWILRGCYVTLILGMGYFVLDNYPPDQSVGAKVVAFSGIVLFGGLVLVTDILVRDKQITTISAVYFGLLLGLLLGTILSSA